MKLNRHLLGRIIFIVSLLLTPFAVHAESNPAGEIKHQEDVLSLDKAIGIALSDSTIIHEALSKYNAALEEKKSAFADFLPKVSYSYSYSRFDDQPYSKFETTKTPVSSKDYYHWDFTVAQPIFTGYALYTKHQMAKLMIDLKEVEKRLAILDVTRSVKTAYFNILVAEKFLIVAEETVENLEAHLRDAEKFFKYGVIPYNDLLQSRVALANAVQHREKANSNLEMAVSTLNAHLRMGINRPTRVVDVMEVFPSAYSLEQLTAAALQNRPELKALYIALQNADHAVRLAKSSYYPEVALIGNYERMGNNTAASSNDYGNDHNASVTLQAKWRFFEWGKTGAEVKKYFHEKTSVQEQLKRVEDGVSLEVKNAFLNQEVAKKNIKTAEESLGQAKENFRLTDLQYREQMATTSDVLEARTILSQAQTNYYSALYGYLISEAELERVVGGNLSTDITAR